MFYNSPKISSVLIVKEYTTILKIYFLKCETLLILHGSELHPKQVELTRLSVQKPQDSTLPYILKQNGICALFKLTDILLTLDRRGS